MPRKKVDNKVKNKIPAEFVKERKELIARLLGHQPKINWPLELGITKRLFALYPEPEFWAQLEIPNFIAELDSLKLFAGCWGLEFLKESHNLWVYKKDRAVSTETFEISNEKVGEDISTSNKQNIRNFLK